LRADGHDVMAAQYGLDTLKGDVDATIRTFGRVKGPIVLVGHSYGGTVITHAGMDIIGNLLAETPPRDLDHDFLFPGT
jgi:Alpha/beta hydrolase family